MIEPIVLAEFNKEIQKNLSSKYEIRAKHPAGINWKQIQMF